MIELEVFVGAERMGSVRVEKLPEYAGQRIEVGGLVLIAARTGASWRLYLLQGDPALLD